MPRLNPATIQRFEGVALAAASVALLAGAGHPWWWLVVLFLWPDLSMLGYLRGSEIGARWYNAAHNFTAPIATAAIGWISDLDALVIVGLAWVFHVGVDRALGYGLKFPDAFTSTHLGEIGKRP